MLGKNLGKKVGADFINKEYHKYLKKQDDTKDQGKDKKEKTSSKESAQSSSSHSGESHSFADKQQQKKLKREAMRKKGQTAKKILPTDIEKPKVALRPFICKLPTRKLRWKGKPSENTVTVQ
ncbi:hypothetical protein COOONC_16387, partial [Cooperia oncophora]